MSEVSEKILAINCGSSSIKFELFDMSKNATIASGLTERIGESTGRQAFQLHNEEGPKEEFIEQATVPDHQQGLLRIAEWLTNSGAILSKNDLLGIGHRVVHGGAEFSAAARINGKVLASIRNLIPLAPLHNPASLCGIEVAMATWPDTPQVAVFDTAFHQTIPPYAFHYALPADLAHKYRLRRYGFHGTSHQYVARQAAELLGQPSSDVNLIVLHLGNGASATAIRGGMSVDTSMGMTPLEGLMMGTRCGDLDPGLVLHLAQTTQRSVEDVDQLLNQESGLKGVCGFSDMREVLRKAKAGDQQAELAVEMYTYRIKKYLGAYFAVLPRVDAIVFTAGVGENAKEIRSRVCSNLEHLGIRFSHDRNGAVCKQSMSIHADGSATSIFVIPTDEELEMAFQTLGCVRSLA